MRLSEALANCPELVLVEQDPAAAEEEWERILRRLEEAGLAVEPVEPGCAYFETEGVERMAGGISAVLRSALDAIGPYWQPRIGVAGRRFAALAAASVAPAGRAIVVDDAEAELFLEPLPLHLLPLSQERREELTELGIKQLGQLSRLPSAAVRDRMGREAAEARRSLSGEDDTRVAARRPAAEIAEALEFPEPVANEVTLELAFSALLDRLLAREERGGRLPRRLAVSARLVGGGSWRRATTLREATAERGRLRAALGPKLLEIPAPVMELRLEAVELADHVGNQLTLVSPEGDEMDGRLREGLRQVRASTGSGSVCAVVEVAPWSRIPETRALVVPRDV